MRTREPIWCEEERARDGLMNTTRALQWPPRAVTPAHTEVAARKIRVHTWGVGQHYETYKNWKYLELKDLFIIEYRSYTDEWWCHTWKPWVDAENSPCLSATSWFRPLEEIGAAHRSSQPPLPFGKVIQKWNSHNGNV